MSDAARSLPHEKDLLLASLDLPTVERERYLEQACQGNGELKARVHELLRNVAGTDSFMAVPAVDLGATTALDAVDVGSQIDRYRLMEPIGEGGMGVVYAAEQTEPVRRLVALKVIKPGMDSKQVIARFEAERQALALMDHPNIARVLDAGTTPQRLPYFVMELVRGLPITHYCDQAKASLPQRLRLFIDVCAAVQHAHRKGIIHRDLKPSNVMVTLHDGTPVVKVIDFGVAKALYQQLSPHTIYTAFNQVVGTPLYMSPEQLELSGLDIDTRTDVYALGVLLYELISGSTPFDHQRLLNSGFDEMRRIIREEDPPRPSHRVTTIPKGELSTAAEARGLDHRELPNAISSELDWITLKALAKDRSRRYGSANDLAEDVQRYLSDAPVMACPPSVWYTTSKFARKHRVVLTSAVLLVVALLAGAAASVYQAVRATKAERQSDARLAEVVVEQGKTRAVLVAMRSAESEQRRLREHAETLAQQAKQTALQEEQLREQAEAAARESQWNLYVANLASMQAALKGRELGRLEALLKSTIPAPGEPDYRGWEWYYLQQVVDAARRALPADDGQQSHTRVSCNPTKNEFAAFTPPTFIDVWDANTLVRLRRFDCKASVSRMEWSPDGDRIAVGSYDTCELVVLDSAHGTEVWRSQPVPTRAGVASSLGITGLSWNSDNQRIAVGSRYGDIAVVNLQDRSTVVTHSPASENHLRDLDWQPGGDRLAAGMRFGSRLIFNTRDNSRAELTSHNLEVGFAVAWSKSGKYLATGEGNGIRIADARGQDVCMLSGHRSVIEDLVWRDDRFLVSASRDHSVRIWDMDTQSQVDRLQLFDEPVYALDVTASGENVIMASGHGVKLARFLRDALTPQVHIPEHTGHLSAPDDKKNAIWDLQWSSDGTQLCALGEVFHTTWVDCVGAVLSPLSARPISSSAIDLCKGISWSTDSMSIVRADAHNLLRVDDARTGIPIQSVPCDFFHDPIAIWSPSTRLVMTHNDRRPPLLRDGASGEVMLEWPSSLQDGMFDGAWNHAESKFIAAGYGMPVLLKTDGTSVPFPDHDSFASFGVAWHPSDGLVALGNVRGDIALRDGDTLELVCHLRGHFSDVNGLAFSPDGSRLASASSDGTVRLWDVATGRELLQLTEDGVSGFSCVAWSHDGTQLAAGTNDRRVLFFGQVGMRLMPAETSLASHGAVYRHLQQLGSVSSLVRNVPLASWRTPLQSLLTTFSGLQQVDQDRIKQELRTWLEEGLTSPEEYGAHILAGLCLIDGHLDDTVALLVGGELVNYLADHQDVLGTERSLELLVDTRYRLCHRLATSGVELASHDQFAAARQTAAQLIEQFPSNTAGWRRGLALEILLADNSVKYCVHRLEQSSQPPDREQLEQLYDAYADYVQRIPSEVLPLKGPPTSEPAIAQWTAAISDVELRCGLVPTFSEQWFESFAGPVRQGTDEHYPYYLLALAQLVRGDSAGYRETCQQMLDRFVDTDDPLKARFTAWTACLAPNSLTDYTPALELYERLHADDDKGIGLGVVLYRMGEFERAREELSPKAELQDENHSPAYAWYFLAMSEARLGNATAAGQWLDRANTHVTEQLAAAQETPSLLWNRIATLRLLQREAEQVVRETTE